MTGMGGFHVDRVIVDEINEFIIAQTESRLRQLDEDLLAALCAHHKGSTTIVTNPRTHIALNTFPDAVMRYSQFVPEGVAYVLDTAAIERLATAGLPIIYDDGRFTSHEAGTGG